MTDIDGLTKVHRREKFDLSGARDLEARSRAVSESLRSRSKKEKRASIEKSIQTRREKYGPTMRRQRVIL